MRPLFERALKGQDQYGNTVMHYFALRKNNTAISELLRVGGCMCARNCAGQSAVDVLRTGELRMLDQNVPFVVVVFVPSKTWRIEAVDSSAPSDKCVRLSLVFKLFSFKFSLDTRQPPLRLNARITPSPHHRGKPHTP